MADTRLNPDQINWESALKEMRDEKMTDDEIHKEIASEFGTTVADQQLGRGKFAKEDTSGLGQGISIPKEWPKVSGDLPVAAPLGLAAAAVAGHYGPKAFSSLREMMASKPKEEGLFATQQAEKAATAESLANATPKEATATQTPKTETPLETKVKPLQPIEKEIVAKGTANTELKKAETEVKAAEKAAAQVAAEAPEGWKPNYTKSAKNPIGPGAFNYLASQYGPEEAAKMWEEQYGKKNVPYSQFEKDWSAAKRPAMPVPEGVKPGGSHGKPTYVPEYIRGSSPVGGMLGAGGAALAALAANEAYKHGKQTGDWSNLGQMGVDAAASLVKGLRGAAAVPYALATHIGEAGIPKKKEEQEIAKKFYEAQVGGGRGIAPPSAYQK